MKKTEKKEIILLSDNSNLCVKGKDLLDGLNLIKHYQGGTNPILTSCLLESIESKQLKITSTNLEYTAIVKIPAEIYKPIKQIIKLNDLLNVAKIVKNNNVSIKFNDDSDCIIAGGKINYTIKNFYEGGFPEMIKETENEKTVKMPFTDFINAINSIMYAAPQKQIEPQQFNGILLKFEADKNIFVTTNSRSIAYNEIKADNKESFEILIYPEFFKSLKTIKSNNDIEINLINNDTVIFSIDNFELMTNIINEPFPPYQSIMNLDDTKSFKVNRKEFIESINAILPAAKESVYTITFKRNNNFIELVALSQHQESNLYIEIKPKDNSINDFIRLNGKMLLECLKSCKDTEIMASFQDSTHPLYIFSDNLKNCILPVIYK
jgi:DNA polymerase III sliding clamp (beta) subunit (PCNA family)